MCVLCCSLLMFAFVDYLFYICGYLIYTCYMVERIKKVMEYEGMTSAHFADYMEIGRAVMSHILNGRNKPSLEVITKILSKIDYIDSNWLLTGEGSMLKQDFPLKQTTSNMVGEQIAEPIQRDLFTADKSRENENLNPSVRDSNLYRKENELKQPQTPIQPLVNQPIEVSKKEDRKITKIIIYYSDNTFETFDPEKIETTKK
jgi:transcriptional regulator with XRE-family HTH domain